MKSDNRLRHAVLKIMSEAAPNDDRVNTSIMSEQIKARLQDEFFEMAFELVHAAEKKIVEEAASIVDSHNMAASEHGRITPYKLRKIVEDFDENIDDKTTLMQECASNLESALNDFAQQLGDYIAHIVSPIER